MPDLHHLLLFIVAGWLLNLTPGPDMLYIVAQALRSGARAGIVGGLGVLAGCFVHIFAAAAGVGALLATSTAAFTALKYLGAAYLFYLGVRALLSRAPRTDGGTELPARPAPARSLRQVFVGGFWTNVLNPKVALFFLAFVPQFIAPDAEHKTLVFLALCALFNLNSLPLVVGWALVASRLARHGALRRGLHWLDRAAGVLFIGFAVKLALTDAPQTR